MSDENYLFRERALVRDFEKSLDRVKPLLFAWLGNERAMILIRASREEYEPLLSRIPYIGRNNPLLFFFLPTPRYLAVYRALQKLELSIEDAGYLSFQIGSAQLKSIPLLARRLCGDLWFSTWFKNRLKKRALHSQRRDYPGNFVMDFVEGDGLEFDYGVDYIECATCKFLESEGSLELAPYICAIDMPASELLGWGLSRTQTLAEGAHKCDFRFKKDGKTRIVLPQSLKLHHGRFQG
jgi:hypothetical protein